MDKRTKNLDRRVRYLNVVRYRRLLKYATNEDRRHRLQELIAKNRRNKRTRETRSTPIEKDAET